MLSKPEMLAEDEDLESKYPREQRKKASWTSKDDQYKISAQSNQYFTLYAHRLEVMRPILQDRAKAKWPRVYSALWHPSAHF